MVIRYLTTLSGGAFDEALKIINPVLYEVRNAVKSLDSVLHIVTGVFDPTTKNNIKGIVENLNTTTASFAITAASLQQLMDAQNGALVKVTWQCKFIYFKPQCQLRKLDSILENARIASRKFAAINLNKTLDTLNVAINNFKLGSENINNKLNSKEGSLGLLLNDKSLYTNLEVNR